AMLKTVGGAAALTAVGTVWPGATASAASNGFGLTITEHQVFGRLHYYRFRTSNIAWDPAVNVLLPDDYFHTTWRRHPVPYLHHGGLQDFRKFHMEDDSIGLTGGRRHIVVMPDGGAEGCYSNPVTSFAGPKSWEAFHLGQLVP